MRAHAATALGLCLGLATAARGAEEGEVRGRAELRLVAASQADLPGQAVRFDPATRAFAVEGYLSPSPPERLGAGLLSASLEGTHLDGRLRWVLSLDSGLVRARRFPRTALACLSDLSPTGLDLAGSARCRLPALALPLPATADGPRQLTSNARPLGQEARDTLFLREAYLEAELGRAGFLTLRAGRKRIAVGDGYVHDDYSLGIEAGADLGALGPQWDLGLSVFWPTRGRVAGAQRRSPMVALRADYLPSLFEHAGAFAAYAHDESGAVSDLFRAADQEAAAVRLLETAPGTLAYRQASAALAVLTALPPQGTSDLLWAGLSGHLALGEEHELSWTGALLFGRVRVPLPSGLVTVPVSGRLGRLRYRLAAARDLRAGAFLVYQSGDLPPQERRLLALPDRYAGFLGVAPFVTETNLFFNGGISESFATRRATAPGVNGRGVLAPGLTAAWEPSASLLFEARAAWLLADEVGPFGRRDYGAEVDLNASWSPRPWLAVLVEADVLFLGDFFPRRAPARRLVLGVSLATP